MRKDFFVFCSATFSIFLASGFFLLDARCLAQPRRQQSSIQEDSLNNFLRDYVRSLHLEDDRSVRFSAVFADLKDDGTHEAIVYFTDQHSCGSSGCTTLILAPKNSSYKIITKITIAWPPVRVLTSKSNGWHDIAVQVHGGGIVQAYEAKLSFDGKTYPSNPTIRPARRLNEKVPGEIVIPITALEGGTPIR